VGYSNHVIVLMFENRSFDRLLDQCLLETIDPFGHDHFHVLRLYVLPPSGAAT
jgi:phospholipase C